MKGSDFMNLEEIKNRIKSPVVILQLISIITALIITIIPEKIELVQNITYTVTAVINVLAGLNNPTNKEEF